MKLLPSLVMICLVTAAFLQPCMAGEASQDDRDNAAVTEKSTQAESEENLTGVAGQKMPATPGCSNEFTFGGYLQGWFTIMEELENGLQQPFTGDEAVQESSGFSFHRARVFGEYRKRQAIVRLSARLENAFGLLDAYVAYPLKGRALELHAGQMKVPSTYEVETSSSNLDFAARSTFSAVVVDYSLTRSPTVTHQFYGLKTYLRDLGVALKGKIDGFSYFLMVGNGVGANLYIGGKEKKQYLYANSLGAYFYGVRVSHKLIPEEKGRKGTLNSLKIGAHFSTNRHENFVLGDAKSVMDIDRWSWSFDVRTEIAGLVKLTGMIGGGAVAEDFDRDGKEDYAYTAWEGKAVVSVVKDKLEICARYDSFGTDYNERDIIDYLDSMTLGINYCFSPEIRFQLNYKWKITFSETEEDLDDNVLVLVAQVVF